MSLSFSTKNRLILGCVITAMMLSGCSKHSMVKDSTSKHKQNISNKPSEICTPQSHYPNPLDDMGEIINIHPPSSGPYPYFKFLEGPVWVDHIDGGSLFFSDLVAPARIWKLTPPSTTPVLYLEKSGSNGLAYDNNNNLLIADREERRITRLNLNNKERVELIPADGKFKPNDIITRHDNNVYFTASKSGFYHITPRGTLNKPIKTVYSPNGIGLSVDESTLYIGDFTAKTITSFKLNNDGSVNTESSTLFTTTKGDKVDGMSNDCAGNIYVASTAGVEVFSPAGNALGIIPTGRSSNTTFGGPERKTLYITTPNLIKAVKLSIPGLAN